MSSYIPIQRPYHCLVDSVEWRTGDPNQPCWMCGAVGVPGEWRDVDGRTLPTVGSGTWNSFQDRDGA